MHNILIQAFLSWRHHLCDCISREPFVTGSSSAHIMIVANDVALSGRKLWSVTVLCCTLGSKHSLQVANSPPGSRRRWSSCSATCAHYIVPQELQKQLPHPRRQSLLHLHGIQWSYPGGRLQTPKNSRLRDKKFGDPRVRDQDSCETTVDLFKRQNNASRSRTDTSVVNDLVSISIRGSHVWHIPLSPLRKCYSVHHSLWVDLRVGLTQVVLLDVPVHLPLKLS
jgi:hypothetical protein